MVRRIARRGGLSLAVVLLLAAATAAPAASLTKTPLGTNLVKNPGAELQTGGDGYQLISPSKWTQISGSKFTVVKYGSPGFPTQAESTRIGGGKNFFSCGNNVDEGTIFQTIRLLGRNTQIDAGLLWFTYSGRIATYDSQADEGRLRILGSANSTFSTVTFAISSPDVIASDGKFLKRQIVDVIPPGTRYLRVVLDADLNNGVYCDAYFDKLSLVIKKL